jgi:hypothetical protein
MEWLQAWVTTSGWSFGAVFFFALGTLLALSITWPIVPWVSRFRTRLVVVASSAFVLCALCISIPLILQWLSLTEVRRVDFEDLPKTEWLPGDTEDHIEPATEAFRFNGVSGFTAWTRRPSKAATQWLGVYGRLLLAWEEGGSLVGRDAYGNGALQFRITLPSEKLIQHELRAARWIGILGGVRGTYLVSVDLSSPALVWMVELPGAQSPSFAWDTLSQKVIVGLGEHGVYAFQGQTGKEIWRKPDITTDQVAGANGIVLWGAPAHLKEKSLYWLDPSDPEKIKKAPIAHAGAARTITRTGEPGALILLSTPGAEELLSVRAGQDREDWRVKMMGAEPIHDLIWVDRALLTLSLSGEWTARSPQNGKVLWQRRFSGYSGDWTSIAKGIWGDLILLPETGGSIAAFSQRGEWQASFRFGDPVLSVISVGRWWFVSTETEVRAIQWSLTK